MDKEKRSKTKKRTKDLLDKLDRQFGKALKGSAKKKTEGKQQSAQVNSKAPILGDSRATVPEQRQSESQSMLLNRSDQENENDHSVVGHQVIIRGRVVVFNDKGTLCSIPLHMQRDIYRQTPHIKGSEMVSSIIYQNPKERSVRQLSPIYA